MTGSSSSPSSSTVRTQLRPASSSGTRLVYQYHPQLRFAYTTPRATGGEEQPGPSTSTSSAADEAAERRIAALEASKRAGSKARRQIPIRGVTPSQQEEDPSTIGRGYAEWKKGELFPEGWEEMDLPTKVMELYMGKRGVLYWATQSAWYSVWILLGAWILFRFIGPALGLYQLSVDG
jgi:hypothetical protein